MAALKPSKYTRSALKSVISAVARSQAPLQVLEPGPFRHKLGEHPPLRGPATHGLYEIAICFHGRMLLVGSGRMIAMEAGDVVLIAPGAWHYETYSDRKHPYKVCWLVAFAGQTLCNLSSYRKGRFEAHWLRGFSPGRDDGSFFLDLIGRVRARKEGWKQRTRGLVLDLLHDYQRSTESIPQAPTQTEFEPVDKLLQIMKTRFREPIEIRALAREVGLTPNYLSYLFKKKYHTTFTNYLNVLRAWYATHLLEQGLAPKEIAVKCGFKNVFYFTTVFRQKCGIAPGQYRKACRLQRDTPAIPRVAPTILSSEEGQ